MLQKNQEQHWTTMHWIIFPSFSCQMGLLVLFDDDDSEQRSLFTLVRLLEAKLQSFDSTLTLLCCSDVAVSGHLFWDHGKDVSVLENPSQLSLGFALSPDPDEGLCFLVCPWDIPGALRGCKWSVICLTTYQVLHSSQNMSTDCEYPLVRHDQEHPNQCHLLPAVPRTLLD